VTTNDSLQYRQGDVLLRAVAASPPNVSPIPREDGRIVLAHGEATGHSHAIADPRAELVVERGTNRRLLLVRGDAPVDLVHEEHATLRIAPGTYEVRGQREFVPQRQWSPVQD
jgi:hypothetical protein